MSSDFFNILGEQLYKIKNNPFRRFGQKSSLIQQNSLQLSYNPNRLFKPQQYAQEQKMKEEDDPAYKEFRRQQQQKLLKIQYEILRDQTNLEYRNKVKQMQQRKISRQQYTQPFSLFQGYRSLCTLCTACDQYVGNFNPGIKMKFTSPINSPNHSTITQRLKDQIELLQCTKCKCPMNSHLRNNTQNPFHDMLWKFLQSKEIQESDLRVSYTILAVKVQQTKHSRNSIYSICEILKKLGYIASDVAKISKLKFQIALIKCILLHEGVQKGYVQTLLSILQAIDTEAQQRGQQWNWNTEMMPTSQHFTEQYNIIKKLALSLNLGLQPKDRVYVMLVRGNSEIVYNEFEKLIKSVAEKMKPFQLLWASTNNNTISFLAAQQLFPQYFKMQYRLFFIPSAPQLEHKFNSERFKDLLDYNSYILLLENLHNIERSKVQKALSSFSYSKINYLLGEEIVSQNISKLGIKVCTKIGPPQLKIPFGNSPDFVSMQKQQSVHKVFNQLYPQFLYSQRCVIILRPFLLAKNFQEALVNLFRINNFILLKRVKLKLSQSQARYLAILQHIDQKKVQNYVQYMTSGAVEIILVSKRSALYSSYALCHGSIDGFSPINTKLFKQPPHLQIQRGRQTLQCQLQYSAHESMQGNNLFDGIRNCIAIEKVLFGVDKCRFSIAKNVNTGQIIKIEQGYKKQQGMQISYKVGENLLNVIKNDSFNYWMYSSKSDTLTQELVGMFLPECSLFSYIILIVKPGFTHLTDLIQKALYEHRYHIISQKQVQLSKALATQAIFSLQKVKKSNQQLRQIIDTYSTQKIHLFCVSKISGRTEMISFLSDFTFLSNRSILVQQYLNDRDLKDVLVPVWPTGQQQKIFRKILCFPLQNLQHTLSNLDNGTFKDNQKFQILNFMVGSYFGVSIKNLALQSKLGKFSYYLAESAQTAKQQSWYYSEISRKHPTLVPLLFQYRSIGALNFVIQSENGASFMSAVVNMYLEQKQKLQSLHQTKRKSLILYLFAKKLAEMLDALSETKTELKGFGKLKLTQGGYKGQYSNRQMIEFQNKLIDKVYQMLGDNVPRQIDRNLKKVKSSRLLHQRYKDDYKRLLPCFQLQSLEEGLRIVETQHTNKLKLIDKMEMIDPENEKNCHNSLYAINLYNVIPEISSKYSMMAEVIFFFLKWQFEALEYNDVFKEIGILLNQLLIGRVQLQILEFQIYIKYLQAYVQGAEWVKPLLRAYPSLRKQHQDRLDDATGKKRKFLNHKQYFMRKGPDQQQIEYINEEYRNFNINSLNQPLKQNALYNPNDPLHKRWASPERKINLLRQQQQQRPRKGIYVQYEKKISENQQAVMKKIKNQVEKFYFNEQGQKIRENGLQQQLWYRRVKGEKPPQKKTQTDLAIEKQIGKFLSFKQEEKKKRDQQFNR